MIGIYILKNIINNKVYVGSSNIIEDRKEYHYRMAKDKKNRRHAYTKLYEEMREFGFENFSFEIVELCSVNELEKKEQEWTNKYPNELIYNTQKNIGKVRRGTESSAAKLSNQDLDEIISLLKENKFSDRKIAEKYNICFNSISEINNGISYVRDDIKYPIRIFKQKGHSRFFTEDEVRFYRKLYENNNHQAKKIYKQYNIKCCYQTFYDMCAKFTYKEIE